MRRTALCAALLALAAAGPSAAALPRAGALVPGRSLGGVRLGESQAQVVRTLGHSYGLCRGCRHRTWYFTYRRFDAHGLAVELTRGRVSAVYTVWQPAGWHGPKGLHLGAYAARVTAVTGPLLSLECAGYTVLAQDSATARTAYYLLNQRLWGFGLLSRGANPCR